MSPRFPTTRWSRIGQVGDHAEPETRAALDGLCRDYWFPLCAFVRAGGHGSHAAEDIVQGFFADLLERRELARLDQSKGRFRSFLRAACDHYLCNRRDHDRAAKRGGAISIVSIDRHEAEDRYGREPAHKLTPQRLFEREWALALLSRVLERLETESVQAENGVLFERIRPALQKDGLAPSYQAIADLLGMSAGAVRAAARRIRLRYRELLREEVCRTTDDPEAVDEETGELLAALTGG
jgi:DNA-directed RNA polymerase specialized sigma24 family protein